MDPDVRTHLKMSSTNCVKTDHHSISVAEYLNHLASSPTGTQFEISALEINLSIGFSCN